MGIQMETGVALHVWVLCRGFALKEKFIQFLPHKQKPAQLPHGIDLRPCRSVPVSKPGRGTGLMLFYIFIPAIYCILSTPNIFMMVFTKSMTAICVFLAGPRLSVSMSQGPGTTSGPWSPV